MPVKKKNNSEAISIFTWNVNGIRAAQNKGFMDWFKRTNADIVCLQETKAQPEQLDDSVKNIPGYESHWFSAQKKGYSGVCIYSCLLYTSRCV